MVDDSLIGFYGKNSRRYSIVRCNAAVLYTILAKKRDCAHAPSGSIRTGERTGHEKGCLGG